MGNNLAIFIAWGGILATGNSLTNLMSVGPKSNLTGEDPPKPAVVGGLDSHGIFEGNAISSRFQLDLTTASSGDASKTRGDFYFGDNHSFNETLFQSVCQAIFRWAILYPCSLYHSTRSTAQLSNMVTESTTSRLPAKSSSAASKTLRLETQRLTSGPRAFSPRMLKRFSPSGCSSMDATTAQPLTWITSAHSLPMLTSPTTFTAAREHLTSRVSHQTFCICT